jgi:pyruvate/2-oxoglutarate dehydrogenase complex dihydrolipoamide dehydrogenase (E3) component
MHPPMPEYDLVVIGSGSGGQKAAIAAAKLGKSVAVIEHDRMLGNCRPGGRMGHWMLNKAAFSLAPGSLPGALRDRQNSWASTEMVQPRSSPSRVNPSVALHHAAEVSRRII